MLKSRPNEKFSEGWHCSGNPCNRLRQYRRFREQHPISCEDRQRVRLFRVKTNKDPMTPERFHRTRCEYRIRVSRDFFDPTAEQQAIVLVDSAILRQAERLIESC